jgi:hypothetical protein
VPLLVGCHCCGFSFLSCPPSSEGSRSAPCTTTAARGRNGATERRWARPSWTGSPGRGIPRAAAIPACFHPQSGSQRTGPRDDQRRPARSTGHCPGRQWVPVGLEILRQVRAALARLCAAMSVPSGTD